MTEAQNARGQREGRRVLMFRADYSFDSYAPLAMRETGKWHWR
jgi:hypothetical protein